MKKLLPATLVLASSCSAALAQAPSVNLMPDGSHDMYVGIGAAYGPVYEGAQRRSGSPAPLLQMEWSNGVFVAGMNAGIHLSRSPGMEFGPLLELQPGRTVNGTGWGAGPVNAQGGVLPAPQSEQRNRLVGMREVDPRLQAGGFFNYTISPGTRLTNSFLYGAGHEHKGAIWRTSLQHALAAPAPHHRIALSLGVDIVNRSYNETFFGVSEGESSRSFNQAYRPGAGIKDVHAELRWNWALSPAWMLVSKLQAQQLTGDAKESPLVERPLNLSATMGLAYRF
jgi:outer membrane protein